MDWQEELHEHRYEATLAQARQEHRAKKRGYKLEAKPTGNLYAVAAFVALAGSALWWKREGHKLAGRDWRNAPGVKQVLAFLSSGKPDRGLYAKPGGAAGAAAGKAAQARQQVGGSGTRQGPPGR
jgi:hypothetical protein